jgi:hypothetical protein
MRLIFNDFIIRMLLLISFIVAAFVGFKVGCGLFSIYYFCAK